MPLSGARKGPRTLGIWVYCISSVLIGSLNSSYKIIYSESLCMEKHCTNCNGVEKKCDYSNHQDLMKFNKTIIPFALVGYEIG